VIRDPLPRDPTDRFFELARDLLSVSDAQGLLRRLNPAWEQTLGFPIRELEGQPYLELIHPADRARAAAAREATLAGMRAHPVELRFRHRDRGHRWLQWTEVLEPLEPLIYAAARDVTDAKAAEAALRESEQRYRELFVSHPVPMAVWEPTSDRILAANDAALAQYGYTRDELQGLTIDRLVHPDDWDRLAEALSSIGSGLVGAAPFRHLRKDGSIVEVEVTGHALDFAGRPARLVMALDVTERRRLEERLTRAERMEAIGQLAGGVAHDFNNLLTAISGAGHLLLADFVEGDPRRDDAAAVLDATERGAQLVRQLLAFGRRQRLQPVVVDLTGLVAELTPMLRRLIGEHIELRQVAADDLGLVRADPGQLEQVVMNLAVNGRDAMPDGGELIIETANVELDEHYARTHPELTPGPYVLLAVGDTGKGIDEETWEHLFEPFYTTKPAHEGTGLGLATVYGIVRQSGGHIAVYSEPQFGTTFWIYLPRVSEAARTMPPEPVSQMPIDPGARILLAEDEEAVRILTTRLLERMGHRVVAAASGGEALDLLAAAGEEGFDLLLTDVVMPGLSGPELADRVRAEQPGIRVLLMSGYAGRMIEERGLGEGGLPLLEKPFSAAALSEAIREALGR
jgi:two-component system cell cycle sensor histidine kinase/response regulator CckA